MQLYSPSHAYQIRKQHFGDRQYYSDSVLSANAVLIHEALGFELLWALRHNFILI